MGGDFCCAVGCHNHRAAPANQNVSFHAFPRDVQRRAKWIAAVRREHWVPVKRSRLCSIHFSPESYELSSRLATDFGLGQKYPRLTVDAVPTIFSHIVARPTPHRGALAKRRRKDVSQKLVSKSVRYLVHIVIRVFWSTCCGGLGSFGLGLSSSDALVSAKYPKSRFSAHCAQLSDCRSTVIGRN